MRLYEKNMNKIAMERTLRFALKQMNDGFVQLRIDDPRFY